MSLSEKRLSNEEMLGVSGGAGGADGTTTFKIAIVDGGVNAILCTDDGTPTKERIFIPGGTVIEMPTLGFGEIVVKYQGKIVLLLGTYYKRV